MNMQPLLSLDDARHLLFRAGFGPKPGQIRTYAGLGREAAFQGLLEDTRKFKKVQVSIRDFPEPGELKELSKEERAELRKKAGFLRQDLNVRWLEEMSHSKGQLREKMALFWHDHFATRIFRADFVQQQLHLIRTHALGSFREMLFAISKDAAMLQFLNNQQNRKAHPNENFAREVLELFTLGRGHYTETDIKEAARAFTGWGFKFNGDFVFRKWQHDKGIKTFLGKTGDFNGDDILNILLDHPRTAYYLTEKICKYLIHENPDKAFVENAAKVFRDADYQVSALLRYIFTSNHFYQDANRGTRIKSPVEFIVSLNRILGLNHKPPEGQIFIQNLLGQILFRPPSVAGWTEGRGWIDSTTLLARLKIPKILILQRVPDLELAENPDIKLVEELQGLGKIGKIMKAKVDWRSLKKLNEEKMLIVSALAVNPSTNLAQLLQTNASDLEAKTLLLVSSPEFQMS